MAVLPSRKTRLTRTAPVKAQTGWLVRLRAALLNADLLLRLAITALAMLLLLLATLGWRSPFPYRLGDKIPDGMLARLDFNRVNERKTDLARLEVEDQIPLIYSHSPIELWDLQYRLRQDLFEIAAVNSPGQLAVETRVAFGFSRQMVDEQASLEAQQALPDWKLLNEVVGPSQSAEQRIDEIVGEFNQFAAPLRQFGVMDPNELARRDLRPEQKILVRNRDDEKAGGEVLVANVLLTEMLKTTGSLGRQWDGYPTLKKLQPVMERWLVHRVPHTLTYDENATIEERRLARQKVEPIRDSYKRGALLIAPGSRLDEESLAILQAQY